MNLLYFYLTLNSIQFTKKHPSLLRAINHNFRSVFLVQLLLSSSRVAQRERERDEIKASNVRINQSPGYSLETYIECVRSSCTTKTKAATIDLDGPF